MPGPALATHSLGNPCSRLQITATPWGWSNLPQGKVPRLRPAPSTSRRQGWGPLSPLPGRSQTSRPGSSAPPPPHRGDLAQPQQGLGRPPAGSPLPRPPVAPPSAPRVTHETSPRPPEGSWREGGCLRRGPTLLPCPAPPLPTKPPRYSLGVPRNPGRRLPGSPSPPAGPTAGQRRGFSRFPRGLAVPQPTRAAPRVPAASRRRTESPGSLRGARDAAVWPPPGPPGRVVLNISQLRYRTVELLRTTGPGARVAAGAASTPLSAPRRRPGRTLAAWAGRARGRRGRVARAPSGGGARRLLCGTAALSGAGTRPRGAGRTGLAGRGSSRARGSRGRSSAALDLLGAPARGWP